MKNKLVYKHIGKVLIVFSILLLIPILISLLFRESIVPFIIPLSISLLIGMLLDSLDVKNKTFYHRRIILDHYKYFGIFTIHD